jgi:pSer/pThr/pTyr-binding forkhead associated (FHA) protein/putative methionine-R-sulfoxide reductase with GAF domain
VPARLTLYPTDQPTRQFSLDPECRHLVGRGSDCDLRVDDPRLSRRHAWLAVAEGCWRFGDLDSKNGTTRAGRTADDAALRDGDWISFGGLLGQFADLSAARCAAEERRTRIRWEDTIDRSRRLDPKADVDELLQQMLGASMELAGAQRGYVMLADEHGGLAVRARAGGIDPETAGREFPGSRGALARALEARAPVVVCDTSADTMLGAQPSIVIGQIRALVCLPLAVGEQLTGLLYLDSRMPGKVFTRLDVEILEAFAAHAALVIGVATVREELAGLAELLPREISRAPPPEPLLRQLQSVLPRHVLPAAHAGEPP